MKLINWDCLEYLKQIPDKSVDMILQDPPYNTTACAWEWDIMTKIDEFWTEWNRIIKPNWAIVMFWSEPFSSKLRLSNIKNYKYDWVWNKLYGTNIYDANKKPMKYHEIISVFYSKQPTYNKQMIEAKKENQRDRNKNFKKEVKNTIYGNQKEYKPNKKDDTLRNPNSILEYSNQGGECHRTKRLHPTQKPVALIEYLIKTYTNEWEVIFDWFMWSWTTWVASRNLNRDFIWIELNKEYFEIAKNRIEKLCQE